MTVVERNDLLLSVWRYAAAVAFALARRYSLDARDLAQDLAVRVLEEADRFDPARGTPTAWVRLQAWRVVGDRLRRAGRVASIDPATLAELTPVPDPTAEVDAADLAGFVRRAIAGLPDREREVVVTRWLADEQPTQADVAEVLGVASRTVGVRERQAFGRLAQALSGVV
jgi:RNA polymerase sigma-70 factor (ECF subfamily)